jgi:flavin reductase (DIM6/NTAB) family NADH-FMN oxidoreductase RutF
VTGAEVGVLDFRAAMSRLAGAVTIIATGGAPSRASWRGMTATAVCSLCAEPPSLVACVNRATGTWRRLHQDQVFSVNVLAAHHVELARTFAGAHGLSGPARFTATGWRAGELAVPVLADALASFECQLARAVEHGTHVLLIGAVSRVHAGVEQARPLLYHRRRFAGLDHLT